MTPEGVQRLTLQTDSAYTIIPTRGDSVGRNARRLLDSYPGPHVVYAPADNTAVDDMDPALLAWAVRRSDLVILWGCGAYAATIAEVEAMLPERKRVLMIMTACEAEVEWFDRVNRYARRPTHVMRLQCDVLNEPGTVRNAGAMLRPEIPN